MRSLIEFRVLNKAREIKKAKRLIERIPYITLATSNKSSLPWSSPVFCVHDKDYNFYWISSIKTIHSINIKENKNIAIVIYDSTVPEGRGFGVYMKAKASVLNDKAEIEEALKLYNKRSRRIIPPASELLSDAPTRMYKAVPSDMWINDIGTVPQGFKYLRFEIKLS